jgi:hypothetical protein
MPRTPSQNIVTHFVNLFGYKFTGTMFKKELGIANSLLKAGFSEEDIIITLDYLKLHPPAKGVLSLAYVQYVINDILPKAKVKKMTEVQKVFTENTEDTSENIEKFLRFTTNNKLRF